MIQWQKLQMTSSTLISMNTMHTHPTTTDTLFATQNVHCPFGKTRAISHQSYSTPPRFLSHLSYTQELDSSLARVLRIPPNILVNSKDGFEELPELHQWNVKRNLDIFQGWNFVSDSDASCLRKIQLTDALQHSPKVIQWFTHNNTNGKYKSDVCRLVQLYLHGGLYLDNDIQLLSSSFATQIMQGVDVISSLNVKGTAIFQAILGAPPGENSTDAILCIDTHS